jgi:hypothetical protein
LRSSPGTTVESERLFGRGPETDSTGLNQAPALAL